MVSLFIIGRGSLCLVTVVPEMFGSNYTTLGEISTIKDYDGYCSAID